LTPLSFGWLQIEVWEGRKNAKTLLAFRYLMAVRLEHDTYHLAGEKLVPFLCLEFMGGW
jgi:hypothetical protein